MRYLLYNIYISKYRESFGVLKKRIFLILLLVAIVAVTAVACTVDVKRADPKVVSVSIDGITKTTYTACDELNISGAYVIAVYDNGKNERFPLTTDMLDKTSFDMNEPGEQKVRVVYQGQSATFTITVLPWDLTSVELDSVPYVLHYVVGEEVDVEGARIKCSFEGNKTKYYEVTKDMLKPYDNETVGTTTVALSYYGVEMSFDVDFSEKTPIGVKIVDSAANNFVFVGQGDKYDVTGMTVRVTYDNDQTPQYDVKTELEKDVFISIDDTSARALDAVLMYYPSDYKETYTYRFFGLPRVSAGETVVPGQELASNKIDRGGQEIVLDPITSKSYGTVKSIDSNSDGSRTMTVSTLVSYDLTTVETHVGAIIADNGYIGRYGSALVYAKGGGVVESVENGVVTIKTAPTAVFVSNVKEKSFSSMEIISYPTPLNYTDTTLDGMIEGDVINKATGSVRVTYDDGSKEVFGMDDAKISLVNYGKDSVNDAFALVPGRNRILVVYGGVITNCTEFYATVESKYPVQLVIDADTISGREFYYGDSISVSAMTYHVVYNNGDIGAAEQITADMVEEGYSLICQPANNPYQAQIVFRLPDRYLKLIPQEENGDREYVKPTCYYNVSPQPINSVDFITKPYKVYVADKNDISYEGAALDVYYRNNERVTRRLTGDNPLTVINERLSGDWEEIEEYDFSGSGERLYVFTRDSDNAAIPINSIVRKKHSGYEARAVYVDEYGVKSKTYASFGYYLLEGGKTVSSIKLTVLKDADGKEYYKKNYTQYEDWNLSGLELTVTYSDGKTEIVDVLPEMIYAGSTQNMGADVAVKFTYLGATDDNTLSINVTERKPTDITLVRKGKEDYVGRYGTKMDFSGYMFRLTYNAGPAEQISGAMLSGISDREVSSGWWYKMYNVRGEVVDNLIQPGTVVYELYYSYPDANAENGKGYSYVCSMRYTDVLQAIAIDPYDEEASVYAIEVVENRSSVVGIRYEQNIEFDGKVLNPTNGNSVNEESDVPAVFPVGSSNGLPVLAETAAGWEIMLSEYFGGQILDKVITVDCVDADGTEYVDYVRITPSMLDYDTSDLTIGYRKVTINYKNQSCQTYVYVWNALLSGVDVAVVPLQNYIYTAIKDESDLVLSGGVARLTFTKYTRRGVFAGYMSKYIGMESEDLSYSGFVSGMYSKEGRQITINVVYKDYTADELKASYVITVYDRQDVDFSYSNVIFFYGNAAPASYTTKQSIAEFTLPENITLNYIESANMITLDKYLALSREKKGEYIPVTVYDEDKKYAPTMFIKLSDVVKENYIDPVAGKYYVRYGAAYIIDEEDYTAFSVEDRARMTAVPTYNGRGELVETYYVTTEKNLGGEGLKDKIRVYNGIITEKITESEYLDLSDEEKAEYEEIENSYYILMRVIDDRDAYNRFYETASYAFQYYTIIQKVIEVRVETSNELAKVLRVHTKINDGAGNGNPYAIYYLHSPTLDITGKVKTEIEQAYPEFTSLSSVYLASPNEDYFEIIVKFTDDYAETEESKNIVAEIFFRVLKELTTDDFANEMGITLSHINFDFEGKSELYNFNGNNEEGMKTLLKEKWINGVNIIDKAAADGNGTARISYTLTFGDTKTRNGVLQLLGGALGISKTEIDGIITYDVTTGDLGHPSYTIDLSRGTVREDGDKLTIQ